MTPRGAKETSVQVRTEDTSPSVRALEVEVDPERVARAFDQAYGDLARRVRLRGFRPGKAPRSVLERLYGSAMAEEIERKLVSETLPDAMERNGLVPVTKPVVEASPPATGEPFRYTARVEVKPEIRLPELAGLRARRLPVAVRDEDVDRELEALRQRQAVLVEESEATPAGPGHVVQIDFDGRIDGRPFDGGTGREVPVELGSGRFLPGFEEQLEGVRGGEDREIRARFPEDHENPELAGQLAEFQVHVVSVRRREVPALDDEFARDVGDFDSLDALRARAREGLLSAREREARAVLRRTLVDALIEKVPFEVPPGLVEERLRRRLAMAERELAERLSKQALEAQRVRLESEWRPLAEREVREQWLLEAVAQDQGLKVEQDEVDAQLEALARDEGVGVSRLRKAYQDAGLLDALRARILEEKAVEFLLGVAKVADGS